MFAGWLVKLSFANEPPASVQSQLAELLDERAYKAHCEQAELAAGSAHSESTEQTGKSG